MSGSLRRMSTNSAILRTAALLDIAVQRAHVGSDGVIADDSITSRIGHVLDSLRHHIATRTQ